MRKALKWPLLLSLTAMIGLSAGCGGQSVSDNGAKETQGTERQESNSLPGAADGQMATPEPTASLTPTPTVTPKPTPTPTPLPQPKERIVEGKNIAPALLIVSSGSLLLKH